MSHMHRRARAIAIAAAIAEQRRAIALHALAAGTFLCAVIAFWA
ncbi:hypothetical protein [Rhizobium alarense]|nr:hypothetical protein [Rhizobium alarense]